MPQSYAICAMCGNPRPVLEKVCRFCNHDEIVTELSKKLPVFTINIELHMPTVDEALERFYHQLEKIQGAGIKMVRVIHGHGSSGVGGRIRVAFREAMMHGRWSHIIRGVYLGEELSLNAQGLAEFTQNHPSLRKELTHDMMGNPGITLLVLQRS